MFFARGSARSVTETARAGPPFAAKMLEAVHVLVVDEPSNDSEWLIRMLEHRGYQVVGKATEMERALSLAGLAHITLVILSSSSTCGALEIARALIDRCNAAVLYIVCEVDDVLLRRARDTCPNGFLFRPFTEEALYGAIEVSRPLQLAEPATSYIRELRDTSPLTPREQEICQALLRGMRPPEIARTLFISIHTVRRHAQSVFRKLGVHSQIELMHRFGAGAVRKISHS